MLGGNPGTPQNPGSPATNLLYAGEQFDTDMQQYYLRARYYDQNTGRFNRMDPFAGNTQDPQSLHKYLYCHANPVNATDPTGNFEWSIGSVIAAIGIAILAIGIIVAAVGHLTGNKGMASLGWDIGIWGLLTIGAGAVWWAYALKGAHATVAVVTIITMGLIATKAKHGFEDFIIKEDRWQVKQQIENLIVAAEGRIPSHGIILVSEEVAHKRPRWSVSEWYKLPVQYKSGDKVLEYWIDSDRSSIIKVRQALVIDATSNPPVFEEILPPTDIESQGIRGAEIFYDDRWTAIEVCE